MALVDFMERAAVVKDGGRRFICRPPTAETVLRVESLYSREIESIEEVFAETGTLGSDPVNELLGFFTADLRRLAMTLKTCVSLWGGAPGETEEAITKSARLASSLCTAVLGLCDVRRIAESRERVKATDDHDLMGPTDTLVLLAETFGQDPRTVLTWPYEMYLDVLDVIERRDTRDAPEAGTGEAPAPFKGRSPAAQSVKQISLDEIPGVSLRDARKFN